MPTSELHQLLDVHVTWKDFTEPRRFFAVSKDNKWSDIKKHMHVFSQLLDASHGPSASPSPSARAVARMARNTKQILGDAGFRKRWI